MSEVNPISFKQILTLRYDSTLKSTLDEVKWQDFKQKENSKNELTFIENSIIDTFNVQGLKGSSVRVYAPNNCSL